MEQLLWAAEVVLGPVRRDPGALPMGALHIRAHADLERQLACLRAAAKGDAVVAAAAATQSDRWMPPPLVAPPPRMRFGTKRGPKASVHKRKAPTTRYSPHEKAELQRAFVANPYPDEHTRAALAAALGKHPHVIRIYFQNARQRMRERMLLEDAATAVVAAWQSSDFRTAAA